MASDAMVFDTPDKIKAYRYIATLHGLRMEISMTKKFSVPPTACPTRGRALGSAQRILQDHHLDPVPRTRKACLRDLEQICKALGYVE